jgi:hypothetical protein
LLISLQRFALLLTNVATYILLQNTADILRILYASILFAAAFSALYVPQSSWGNIFVVVLLLYFNAFAQGIETFRCLLLDSNINYVGYLISMVASVEMSALIGVVVALVYAIVFSGVNPTMKDVNQKYAGVAFLWDLSFPRWAVEAFWVSEVGVVDYQDISSGTKIFFCGQH